MVLLAA
jgi:transposase